MSRTADWVPNDEPIHGFRLESPVGRGTHGEVWRAIGPGGKPAAVKIIDLSHGSGALRDVAALTRVRKILHPNLVPVLGVTVRDAEGREVPPDALEAERTAGRLKELILATGYAKQSLADRLRKENPDGTPPHAVKGLPLVELIGYVESAARGLDYLNQPDHDLADGDGVIIHGGVRPSNLVLAGGGVLQVADFAISTLVAPDNRRTHASASPSYHAPEFTANRAGPKSDQYSLAVTYYELRTGRLPFPENMTLVDMMMAHANGKLDFASLALTPAERDTLRRATAVRPDDRFETCLKFVRKLMKAVAPLMPVGSLPDLSAEMSGEVLPQPRPIDLPPRPEPMPEGVAELSQELLDAIRGPAAPPTDILPPNPVPVPAKPAAPTVAAASPARPPATAVLGNPPARSLPPKPAPPAPAKKDDSVPRLPSMPDGSFQLPDGRTRTPVPFPDLPSAAPPDSGRDLAGQPEWFREAELARKAALGKLPAGGLPAGRARAERPQLVNRRATVRYYSRMRPDRLFPLVVVVSAEEMKQIVVKAVEQGESDSFRIDPAAAVEVEPVLPGCDVYPPREDVFVSPEPVAVSFRVAPRVLGALEGARVVVRQNGRVLAEVPLAIRVARPTVARVLAVGGLVAPFAAAGLKAAHVEAPGFEIYRDAGRWLLDTLRPDLLGVLLLAAAAAAYLYTMPRRRDAFWDLESRRT